MLDGDGRSSVVLPAMLPSCDRETWSGGSGGENGDRRGSVSIHKDGMVSGNGRWGDYHLFGAILGSCGENRGVEV